MDKFKKEKGKILRPKFKIQKWRKLPISFEVLNGFLSVKKVKCSEFYWQLKNVDCIKLRSLIRKVGVSRQERKLP